MKALIFILVFPVILLTTSNVKVNKKYYQVNYSQKFKQPLTVDYSIRTRTCAVTRSGMEFYAEPGVITSRNADYANNDWDKGHMAPAADFCFSRAAMISTFSYVNCALQHYKLNRGVWKQLEVLERDWAKRDSLIIHIDVIFKNTLAKTPSGTVIPSAFRKSITFYSTKKQLIYEFPNIAPTKILNQYLVK